MLRAWSRMNNCRIALLAHDRRQNCTYAVQF